MTNKQTSKHEDQSSPLVENKGEFEQKEKLGFQALSPSLASEELWSLGREDQQTVQGDWGAARETTQKIKETMVGKAEEKVDDDAFDDGAMETEKERWSQ